MIGASRGGIGAAIAAGFMECGVKVRITGAEPEPIAADHARPNDELKLFERQPARFP